MPRNNTQRLSYIVNGLAEQLYFSGNNKGANYTSAFFWCDPKELDIASVYADKINEEYSHLHICTNNGDTTNAVEVNGEVVKSVSFLFTLRPNSGLVAYHSKNVKITPTTKFYFGNEDGPGVKFDFELDRYHQDVSDQIEFINNNFIVHDDNEPPKEDIKFVYYSNNEDEKTRLFDFTDHNNWYGDDVEKCRAFYMDFLNAVLGLSKVCCVSDNPEGFEIPTIDRFGDQVEQKWSTIWERSSDEGDLDIAV